DTLRRWNVAINDDLVNSDPFRSNQIGQFIAPLIATKEEDLFLFRSLDDRSSKRSSIKTAFDHSIVPEMFSSEFARRSFDRKNGPVRYPVAEDRDHRFNGIAAGEDDRYLLRS